VLTGLLLDEPDWQVLKERATELRPMPQMFFP
jgi:hypothetical protein